LREHPTSCHGSGSQREFDSEPLLELFAVEGRND
jgi:hypothetical protein